MSGLAPEHRQVLTAAAPVYRKYWWPAHDHEASHALVRPLIGAFAAQLRAQGKDARDLWHVALFFATGEVVRQALAARGTAYEPYLYKTGLFDRAWPQFKAPIETHWKAHVNGELPRDDAIKNVVAALK